MALEAKDEIALGALLAGNSVRKAAEASDMDRETLGRRMRDCPEFIAALRRGRAAIREATMSRIFALHEKALDTLEAACGASDATWSDRIAAARTILQVMHHMRESEVEVLAEGTATNSADEKVRFEFVLAERPKAVPA